MKSISYEIPRMIPIVQVRRLCLTESYQILQRTIVPAVVLYQSENLSVALWEVGLDSWRLDLEQRKRECGKLHSNNLHNLHPSTDIIGLSNQSK